VSAVPLADARDDRAFGGKAVQLGAAIRAGLPVPDGFALAADFVAAVVQGDAAALESSPMAEERTANGPASTPRCSMWMAWPPLPRR
jgi:hypothetical protein